MIPCLLSAQDISVERKNHPTNVRGKMVPDPVPVAFSIKGNLQPERNLRTIRETFGSHIEGALKIYSETRLRAKEADGAADIILYQDRKWEVAEVRRYDIIMPHYKMIAILVKDER